MSSQLQAVDVGKMLDQEQLDVYKHSFSRSDSEVIGSKPKPPPRRSLSLRARDIKQLALPDIILASVISTSAEDTAEEADLSVNSDDNSLKAISNLPLEERSGLEDSSLNLTTDLTSEEVSTPVHVAPKPKPRISLQMQLRASSPECPADEEADDEFTESESGEDPPPPIDISECGIEVASELQSPNDLSRQSGSLMLGLFDEVLNPYYLDSSDSMSITSTKDFDTLNVIREDLNRCKDIPEHLKAVMLGMLDKDSEDFRQLSWLLDLYVEEESDLEVVLNDISLEHHFTLLRLLLHFSLICRIVYSENARNAQLVDFLRRLENLFSICDRQSFMESFSVVFSSQERWLILFTEEFPDIDAPLFVTTPIISIVQMIEPVFEMFETRAENLGLLALNTGWKISWGTCECCLLEDSLLASRTCCNSSACRSCISKWVSDRVFTRHIEVSCLHCSEFFTQSEILHFLGANSNRYFEVFADVNKDPNRKTCPNCNFVHELQKSPKRLRRGVSVTCSKCGLDWCFSCHAPEHSGVSCEQFQTGDVLLEEWGRRRTGPQNAKRARRCPRCRVMIEKNDGCNHMTCNRCHAQFCFLCGKNWTIGRTVRIFGHHDRRFSIFGCKRTLLNDKPVRRKLVRGSLFAGTLIGVTVGGPIVLALGLGLLPIILPGIGIAMCVSKKCCC